MALACNISSRCMTPARVGATTVSGCRGAMDETFLVHRCTEGTWTISQCVHRESLDGRHDKPTACRDQELVARQHQTGTAACKRWLAVAWCVSQRLRLDSRSSLIKFDVTDCFSRLSPRVVTEAASLEKAVSYHMLQPFTGCVSLRNPIRATRDTCRLFRQGDDAAFKGSQRR